MRYSFAISSASGVPDALQAANGNPWEALAFAIVAQAALDYQTLYAYAVLRQSRGSRKPEQGGIEELERFFRGKWFAALAGLDGEYLLRHLREKVEQEVLG